MREKHTLTDVQHLTQSQAGYPDWYKLSQQEAEYLLPLTRAEADTVQFALELLEGRAHAEGDEEEKQSSNELLNRVKYDGLIKS